MTQTTTPPATFEQFWPHFLASHRQPLTRVQVTAINA